MTQKILIVLFFLISGCAASYGCPAPKGVRCQRISDVYSSTQKSDSSPKEVTRQPQEQRPASFRDPTVDEKTIPLRTAPKILRVWVAPWIDQDGDLHQEGDLFLVVHAGEWAIGEAVPKETSVRHKEILKAPPILPSNPEGSSRDFPMPKPSPEEEAHEP